ncbi:MAG: hypothetical protein QOH17_2027, partial [Pseudonocardiales bacterium]|nr:hypothetical protein [Pseudonocardiales bacterium]
MTDGGLGAVAQGVRHEVVELLIGLHERVPPADLVGLAERLVDVLWGLVSDAGLDVVSGLPPGAVTVWGG